MQTKKCSLRKLSRQTGRLGKTLGLLALAGVVSSAALTFPTPASAANIQSKQVKVLDSHLHYRTCGQGDPIVFLHGVPVSSFEWRNILPSVCDHGLVVAPDLIGFGRSGKPFIEYTLRDHLAYVEAFIEALGLQNITLVITDLGSPIGFLYAQKHPDNVKALAFFEAVFRFPTPNDPIPPEFFTFFNSVRGPDGWDLVINQNIFFDQLLPTLTLNPLDDRVRKTFEKPFRKEQDRRPLLMTPRQIPIDGCPPENLPLFDAYFAFLQTTDIPKLYMFAEPGLINTQVDLQFAQDNFSNLTVTSVGAGAHLLAEDQPENLTTALLDWFLDLI